jgi:hypothetical protein
VAAVLEEKSSDNVGMEKIGFPGVPKTKSGTANHWVVMETEMTIDGRPAPLWGSAYPDDLKDKRIDFHIYTWGGFRNITKRYPNLTVKQFLRSYHGFVSAARI